MARSAISFPINDPLAAAFALASAVLAYEPLRWLVGTWTDPSYPSTGLLYLTAVGGLLAWSLTSPVAAPATHSHHRAVAILLAAATIRLASQVLAINVIGGVALALDIFAVATLLRVSERSRPVSAFWLSVLFLFCLPVERIAQRLLGYPLQEISATLACAWLDPFVADLACDGVRITMAGRDVLVDLPCSGTIGLMLCMAFMVVLNALHRPRLPVAALWGGVALLCAVLGNGLRIGLLAIGIAYQEAVWGLDVMAQPLHDILGYATLALSMLPVLVFYKPEPAPRQAKCALPRMAIAQPLRLPAAALILVLAVVIVGLPREALDVSRAIAPKALPAVLEGEAGVDEPLMPIERAYFQQYGGHAQKRRYGPLALTLVHTTSPLRHLHSPEDCLRGLGYRVRFLGTRFDPVPTALYRATAADGTQWRVAVTFVSDTGHATSNIAEAIWLWLQNPGSGWTSIQRITPWQTPDPRRDGFEAAVIAALDLEKSKTKKDQDS